MTKKIIFIFLLAILACSSLALSVKAASTLDGLNETAGRVDAFKGEMSGTFDSGFMATKVGQIIGIILSFIGVLFLGLMIYAGITWMMANGNEQSVSKAKDMIVNAAIGIVIVLAAYAITSFLGTELLKQ